MALCRLENGTIVEDHVNYGDYLAVLQAAYENAQVRA
jgi:hypothetical protein